MRGTSVFWLRDNSVTLANAVRARLAPLGLGESAFHARDLAVTNEARVPAVLEMLGVPFTGSDPLTMAVTLDKDVAKKLAAAEGVRVPGGIALHADEELTGAMVDRLIFPLVAKPAWEGSSKGIREKCLVKTPGELPGVIASLRRDHRQTILLEEYIAGDELTVGVYGNTAPAILGVMRVVPRKRSEHFIYSLEIKRKYLEHVAYESPAPLAAADRQAVEQAALTVFRALGCRDIARIDFRLRDGVPYFLEVNPLPGLHPIDSDLVILAKGVGWTYARLIQTILGSAVERIARESMSAPLSR